MTTLTLGIIGCGNMGSAIAHGVLASPALREFLEVGATDVTESAREELERAGGHWFTDASALAAESDVVLLAVKPNLVRDIITGIRPALNTRKTLVSIAAGQPLTALRAALNGVCAAVQAMPNTPTLVGDGVFGLCFDDPALIPERKDLIHKMFAELGTVFTLPENMMNALMAVTGCGPAYVFAMMDAIMEAAATLGFSRKDATEMVTALFRGSAKMVEDTGLHPGVLHSQVASPKGSTIAGTNHLSRTAVRGHIIDAVLAAAARGKEMEKE